MQIYCNMLALVVFVTSWYVVEGLLVFCSCFITYQKENCRYLNANRAFIMLNIIQDVFLEPPHLHVSMTCPTC